MSRTAHSATAASATGAGVAPATGQSRAPRVGESAPRPDGSVKVKGQFAFGSDLWSEGMLWGKTLRSPHASARINRIDVAPALAIPGVRAVITADDVPGATTYGLEHRDQPVFARQVVRYHGEPVAAVAADHPDIARRACAAIIVDYEPLPPLVDAEAAITAAPIHPDGNVFRRLFIRHGAFDEPVEPGAVSVEGTYEVGMQDQAFLGPESGLALPADDGGVDLYVSTQWLHADRDQIAACLALPHDKVRVTLAGVGGAFGGREDVSLHIHVCLLARRSGRPVKMVYSRDESFVGHVHRHPAKMWYRHTARPDGTSAPRRRTARLRWRCVRVVHRRRTRQRLLLLVRPLPRSRSRSSKASGFAPTIHPAALCAASVQCRPVSPTKRRWTSSRPRSASIRSSCGCATPWRPATS